MEGDHRTPTDVADHGGRRREGPLLDAVRKLRETGDRDTLFQMQTRTFDESLQVREVRMIVLNEQAR